MLKSFTHRPCGSCMRGTHDLPWHEFTSRLLHHSTLHNAMWGASRLYCLGTGDRRNSLDLFSVDTIFSKYSEPTVDDLSDADSKAAEELLYFASYFQVFSSFSKCLSSLCYHGNSKQTLFFFFPQHKILRILILFWVWFKIHSFVCLFCLCMHTHTWVLLETRRPRARRLLKHSATLTGIPRGSQHDAISRATCGLRPSYK